MARSLLIVFVVVLLLLSGRVGHADSNPSTVNDARVLMQQGRHMEALEVLRSLSGERPEERNLAFLVGLAAVEAARRLPETEERTALLDEAIAALRGLLVDEPGLVRVRLELARAFFFKGEDGLSRDHFERVLAGNPPRGVVANVRRFLAQIRARRRWSMSLGFALAPDNNIGGRSGERTIYIIGLPFQRNPEDLPKSGVGVSVWGGWQYHYPLAQQVRLQTGFDVSLRDYSGSEFDKALVALHAGPRVLATPTTQFSLLGDARRQWTANRRDYDALGGRFAVSRRFGRRVTGNLTASWRERRYRRSEHLDGPVQSVSLGGSWILRPTVRLNATVGHGRERPETLMQRNRNTWVQTGVSVALPRGFTVSAGAGYRWTDYQGNWGFFTPGGVPREDKTYNVRASVFNRAFTLYGFSPEVAVVREVRKTNAQGSDYKRTSGELRFVRQF